MIFQGDRTVLNRLINMHELGMCIVISLSVVKLLNEIQFLWRYKEFPGMHMDNNNFCVTCSNVFSNYIVAVSFKLKVYHIHVYIVCDMFIYYTYLLLQ